MSYYDWVDAFKLPVLSAAIRFPLMPVIRAKFCAQCGAAVEAAAKFCGQCATPVSRAETVDPGHSGERRQAVILFVDLVGYARLTNSNDPEDTHAILARYFEAVDSLIRGYGGSIDKHIGDAVMGVFGAPVAHGNDTERAIRAGIEIHSAVSALGAGLAVHVGIASGEVVAAGLGSSSYQEYTVTGDAVNVAARLCDRAAANETLICAGTRQATRVGLCADALGDIALKGLPHPVAAWRVHSIAENAENSTDPDARPIVGRRSELRQVDAALKEIREANEGQMLLVRGDPGIGKTRLLTEFSSQARSQGFHAHRILLLDFGAGSLDDPSRQLLRSLLGLDPRSDESTRTRVAEAAMSSGRIPRGDCACLNDLFDLPQPVELRTSWDAMNNDVRRKRRHQMVANLVCNIARTTPLFLSFEDVHWADQNALSQMAVIAGAIVDRPVAMIMTARNEGNPIGTEWRAHAGPTPLSTIDLGPLRGTEAMKLAETFPEADESYVRGCVERADGNPLFLVQLLRSALDADRSAIPQSIQSLILARVDQLQASDRRALQAAAVIGQRFTLDILRQLIGDSAYRCDVLVERGLVRTIDEGFLFAHALIRDGVYRLLLRAARHELHLAAATWYEARDPILHAEHLDLAGDKRASSAMLRAARAMQARYDYDRALQLSRRGEQIALEAPQRFAAAELEGELLRDLGQGAAVIGAYERALAAAGDEAERCRAWIGIADGHRLKDGGTQGRALLESAQKIALELGLDLELSQIHRLLGSFDFLSGRPADSLVEQEQAVKYARRAGNAESEARAMSGVADAHYALGRMRAANTHFRACIDLCNAHDIGRVAIAQLPMAAITRSYLNELAPALEELERAAVEADRAVNRRAQITCHMGAGEMLLQMNQVERAGVHFDHALEIARATGVHWFESMALTNSGRSKWGMGDSVKAADSIDEALRVMPPNSERAIGPFIWGSRALICEDPAEAESALATGNAILAKGAISHNHMWFRRDEMEVRLLQRAWPAALVSAEALERYTGDEPLPWSDFYIRRTRALCALGLNSGNDVAIGELRHLHQIAAAVGLMTALPLMDAVLRPGR
jgi:class 3 adenylate cyclase/tetratricopeptide (TPR) repeat protein